MKMWILSDWHMETRLAFEPPRPDFDVLVAAGDVDDSIAAAIRMVAALAAGKPAVFVAGNHEWHGGPQTFEEKLASGRAAAHRYGVNFLEGDTCKIESVRFAGATLWTVSDRRFLPSAVALTKASADVIVTHFEPPASIIKPVLPTSGVWVYGHHHGHSVHPLADRTLIRNALGYANELIDGPAADASFVYEIRH